MSSTNKTPNYDLSQYVGTDKPTYLGDYNGDMLKIDTQMKDNNDAATNAQESAGEALAKATQAQNDVSGLDTRVDTAEQNITQLQNTVISQGQNITNISQKANTAQTTADGASEVANNALNLAHATKLTKLTAVTGVSEKITMDSTRPIMVAQSEQVGLLFFTGGFNINQNVSNNEVLFTLPPNIKRPAEQKTIGYAGLSFFQYQPGSGYGGSSPQKLFIDTSGNVRCSGTMHAGSSFWTQNVFDTTGWY